jgi:hypothetical protein
MGKYAKASKRYEKVKWQRTLHTKHLLLLSVGPLLSMFPLNQAAKYIEYDNSFSEDEKKQSKSLKISSKLNNAACKLKLKEYREAEKLCTKVL